MRSVVLALCVVEAAAFGGTQYLAQGAGGANEYSTGPHSQASQPGQQYNVGFQTQNPDHYDANGHFDGDYPANYLINQAMADRVGAAGDAHGDIDMADVPDVTVGRRLSDADAEHALLEAAKAGAHESLEGVNIGDSLPALMTEV